MGAAALWGISGVVAKALFNRRIEPWTLVEIRLSGSFLVLLLILVLRRVPLRVPRRQLATLVLLGLAMSAAQFSYYLAISLTDVSTAIFLQYTAPVFVPGASSFHRGAPTVAVMRARSGASSPSSSSSQRSSHSGSFCTA